jgi:glycosyltransferase involved in cell wall biosynthesis
MASLTIEVHRRRETWMRDLSMAVVLTEFARERLLQGGLPPERTTVKPNFVADPGTRTSPPSASNKVLFVGRLSREKGIDSLIAAWQHARLDDLELSVIGAAPEMWSVETPSPGVRLAGQLEPEEVKAKMLESRALVVPSASYEGQPMVILEALAAGLPVLHTDVGALGETCGAGGLSIGTGDVGQMASSLQALTDGESLNRVGEQGRREFERRFNESAGLEALRRIYASATS